MRFSRSSCRLQEIPQLMSSRFIRAVLQLDTKVLEYQLARNFILKTFRMQAFSCSTLIFAQPKCVAPRREQWIYERQSSPETQTPRLSAGELLSKKECWFQEKGTTG